MLCSHTLGTCNAKLSQNWKFQYQTLTQLEASIPRFSAGATLQFLVASYVAHIATIVQAVRTILGTPSRTCQRCNVSCEPGENRRQLWHRFLAAGDQLCWNQSIDEFMGVSHSTCILAYRYKRIVNLFAFSLFATWSLVCNHAAALCVRTSPQVWQVSVHAK